jgi:hypothetical protein
MRGSWVAPWFGPVTSSNAAYSNSIPVQPNTFAIFHTHPNNRVQYPSNPGDYLYPYGQFLPNYVGTRSGLFVTTPQGTPVMLRPGLDWTKPCK